MRYLLIIVLLFIACEGPVGPFGPQGIQGENGIDGQDGVDGTDGINGTNGMDGEQGPQGEQGERGVSKIMFDHTVVIGDYYQSSVTGSWYAGIKHDSIRVSSMIDVYFKESEIDMFWAPILYLGEITDGRLGLFDGDIDLYIGLTLRILIIN